MSARLTLMDHMAAEVVVFGPIAVTRATVHALVLASDQGPRAADFFAWGSGCKPATTDTEPLSFADAKLELGIPASAGARR